MALREDSPNSTSICLSEGEYQFTIYDTFGDGILAPGHYNYAFFIQILGKI